MAAKRVRRVIKVQGTGRFPIDMLRYDIATPYSEADSGLIGFNDDREIYLYTESPFAPHVDRWESFGWKVIKIEDL